jgi:hypothetical protein
MGLFSRAPSPIDSVKTALESFTYKGGLPETKFRDELTKYLSKNLGAGMKREAGIHGEGTRVDIYFEHLGEDFIVTIKQGLSEQKTKTLLGEALVLAQNFHLNEHPRKTNVIALLMTDHRVREEAFEGHGATLMSGYAFLSKALAALRHARVQFHVAQSSPDGGDLVTFELA